MRIVLADDRVLADGAPSGLTAELLSRAYEVALTVERSAAGALVIQPA